MKIPFKAGSLLRSILIVMLLLFGSVTLFMSSSVLFDWFGIREKEGDFVPFVVWANWICGILYFLAVVQLLRRKSSAAVLLAIALLLLVAAIIGLFLHIGNGGLYETKTIGAMLFRTGITAVFLFTSLKIAKR